MSPDDVMTIIRRIDETARESREGREKIHERIGGVEKEISGVNLHLQKLNSKTATNQEAISGHIKKHEKVNASRAAAAYRVAEKLAVGLGLAYLIVKVGLR